MFSRFNPFGYSATEPMIPAQRHYGRVNELVEANNVEIRRRRAVENLVRATLEVLQDQNSETKAAFEYWIEEVNQVSPETSAFSGLFRIITEAFNLGNEQQGQITALEERVAWFTKELDEVRSGRALKAAQVELEAARRECDELRDALDAC